MADSPKKRRTSPGKSGEAVLKEYNHRCSVCGADRPQLHHIDEDPSNQEPLNLLPLCPNHHLNDQHNPTAKVDARLLRLFRECKDPTVLSPQFFPLFQRLLYLDVPQNETLESLAASGKELAGFVAELEMGRFYAGKLTDFLKASYDGDLKVVFSQFQRDSMRYEQQRREALEQYRSQLAATKPEIMKLVVELLHYQEWRVPPNETPSRP